MYEFSRGIEFGFTPCAAYLFYLISIWQYYAFAENELILQYHGVK